MTPVLAALLLSAAGLAEVPTPAPAAGESQEPPAAAPAETPPADEPDSQAPPAGTPAAADSAPATAAPSVDAGTPSGAARPPARILPLDARLEAYGQFREFYEAGQYADALPLAQRVVELSEADAENQRELPIAYNNLGATHYQLGDYAAAELAYKKSLDVLEATQGISSRKLIVPLSALGAVYAAQDQHARAIEMFDRAIAVSRRSEGLFNQSQLPLLEQSADSHFALNDLNGVQRERYYALRIAEQNYGYADPHTVAPLVTLAKFYEQAQEFAASRVMWIRVRDVLARQAGGFDPVLVDALLGICRSHRLQYTLEPATLQADVPERDPVTNQLIGRPFESTRVPPPQLDRAGLRSAEAALELLRKQPDPRPELLTATLIELGDWYQATSRPASALPFYTEANSVFAGQPEGGQSNPLFQPRMIFYRAPQASKRSAGSDAGDIRVRSTVFDFVVTDSGDTQEITVVSTDMLDGQLAQSRRAIARAIYSPRFENGRPVTTRGVRFTSDWYEAVITPAPAGPAEDTPVKGGEAPASGAGT